MGVSEQRVSKRHTTALSQPFSVLLNNSRAVSPRSSRKPLASKSTNRNLNLSQLLPRSSSPRKVPSHQNCRKTKNPGPPAASGAHDVFSKLSTYSAGCLRHVPENQGNHRMSLSQLVSVASAAKAEDPLPQQMKPSSPATFDAILQSSIAGGNSTSTGGRTGSAKFTGSSNVQRYLHPEFSASLSKDSMLFRLQKSLCDFNTVYKLSSHVSKPNYDMALTVDCTQQLSPDELLVISSECAHAIVLHRFKNKAFPRTEKHRVLKLHLDSRSEIELYPGLYWYSNWYFADANR